MAAIQPRINKAIIELLSGDDTLKEALINAGALVTPADGVPLFWFRAPSEQVPPYLVFGPQDAQSTVERTLCGAPEAGVVVYMIDFVTKGINPEDGLEVADRLTTLLDRYSATVDDLAVSFLYDGDHWYPDFAVSEHGETHSLSFYRCRVAAI